MMEEQDVQFITEEKFDFSILSPSDSREDDDDDEEPPGGTNGRWSPLSGAGLEEMVREATRLAAQLQQCHLSPLPPGPGGGSPRSPRRETFVVKDSPVRALLPTVPAASVPKESPRCRPPAPPRGAPSSRGTPRQSCPPRPCPARGAVARGRSEPLRAETAGNGGGAGKQDGLSPPHGDHIGNGNKARAPPAPPFLPAQPKLRSSAATPPSRAPRARATTAASTAPSSRPPPPSAIPKPPGRAGTAAGGRGAPRSSTAAPRGAPLGLGAASRCRLGPPGSRLQPPRKTAAGGAPR
ncbi:proline/serine-rich coiled-coil protein 1 isoform X1 [Tympanuchus pallidicinctus]|uniref:proline/serine-rich coiled-coil protein 1 isoform X1 n=1 Tax=Tympanuchus pallidicinctus TaxID=109042 RepID=UPI0022871EDC|nr:proline/serine-rich coiled-coil protein 1 isoform X1 [Tympanuchus pallidicinctus]XP_052558371.1 proline/serine-rich coiled-coil protein 1 isoform X1 [Tympanuchus pallidicinctus]XP_052558372.1 proline/serine-rich coiled-coil protein 1 isoform X1 [Tympanuchus pallidicinctus]XP_052558373.1 proline/serine-rich coiled-coil protein 1 isoform X1 [Tympanuchus pallidicinctus]